MQFFTIIVGTLQWGIWDYTTKSKQKSVEESLQNLKTKYKYLLLLHRLSPLMKIETIEVILVKLKYEIQVNYFGN